MPSTRISPGRRLLRAADAACNRLYGWRWNPLHQPGTVAVAMLLVLLVTGLYLVLVYRVGDPAGSVARMAADPWLGSWNRSLHRYASDLFVLAAVFHGFRMFAQRRSWGARSLAWVSGVSLVGVGLVCAWTGFVMVWDGFGLRLARAGGRLLDALPILSEPVSRIFAGDAPIASAFFFVNLFLHILLPLSMGVGLWLHVSRLARPVLLPPRRVTWALIAGLTLTAIVLPAPLGPAADPLILATDTTLNLVTSWWVPLVERLPPGVSWAASLAVLALVLAIPRLTRQPREGVHAPSHVDPQLCTGCNQCPQDCPWDAITMVPRTDDRPTLVALVDASRCVSCGICAGSCPPMGVGPPGRTGRDQLTRLWEGETTATPRRPAVLCCGQAPAAHRDALAAHGADVRLVPCVGNVHSSVVELLLRSGVPGVMVAGCPPRDCVGREGPKWLHARMYLDREAELQARVDRRRVGTITLAPGALPEALAAWDAFVAALPAVERAGALRPDDMILEAECLPDPAGVQP